MGLGAKSCQKAAQRGRGESFKLPVDANCYHIVCVVLRREAWMRGDPMVGEARNNVKQWIKLFFAALWQFYMSPPGQAWGNLGFL